MSRTDFKGMALPDLVNSAMLSLQGAQEALSILADRIDPSLKPRAGTDDSPAAPMSDDGDILASVPEWLRAAYLDFRQALLDLSSEIEPRPAPLRDGMRRYEGFLLRGRNVIYANFRRSFIRINFELPEGHSVPSHEVTRSGERDFRKFELRNSDGVDTAVRLARETIASVTSVR